MKTQLFRSTIFIVLYLLVSPVYSMGTQPDKLQETSKAFANVARSVAPSVVFVQVEGAAIRTQVNGALPDNPWPFGEDFFKHFFGDRLPGGPQGGEPPQQKVTGQGSGFVFKVKDGLLSDKTYILTNNHVVENADKITVKFQDGREFEAKVTGTDPKSDVAVIEISGTDAPPLKLADSSHLEVGEWVVAIGNPFGLSNTLTVGVVSATGRTSLGISDYEDFIQTDAAINPGNSGGPLLNLNGEVVGINTAIFSRSGGYMGLGFAIPSNLVSSIAAQLIKNGSVTRGYLGVVIQSLNPDLVKSFGLDNNNGILVSQVSEDSPASRAGLKAGDVIVEYQGKMVKSLGQFRNRVALTSPGSRENLGVIRNGKHIILNITIGKLSKAKTVLAGKSNTNTAWGITVQNVTPSIASQFNIKPGEGVVVAGVQPNSIAAAAGIQAGAVILEVNRKPVHSVDDFNKLVEASSKNVLLLIRTNDGQRFIALSR